MSVEMSHLPDFIVAVCAVTRLVPTSASSSSSSESPSSDAASASGGEPSPRSTSMAPPTDMALALPKSSADATSLPFGSSFSVSDAERALGFFLFFFSLAPLSPSLSLLSSPLSALLPLSFASSSMSSCLASCLARARWASMPRFMNARLKSPLLSSAASSSSFSVSAKIARAWSSIDAPPSSSLLSALRRSIVAFILLRRSWPC
mmetsp:Transcript_26190/g.75623  ORF Transcript_26190/g.75623 Transcript_26190/m.75623 type:complete len:205 (+) Transcript_26190:892-1506(+)